MPRNLPHIFARVFNTPLAVAPARLDPLLAGLRAASLHRGSRLNGEDHEEPEPPELPEVEIDITWDRSKARSGYAISPQGVAWLPIRGVMVKREGEIDADSTEFESYARVGSALRTCLNDQGVRAILLDVDSCGGEVGGLFDLAADIRTAASVKPIWAIANDDALSAGYAIASAASRVIITRVAGVGSVGVVAMHTDQSGFDAEEGFAYTYVFAGQHKVDGNAHEPLSTEARAAIQQEVDRIYGMFVDMVALHRGLEANAVRATEATVYFGPDAITAGLADQLGSFPQAIAALGKLVSGRTGSMENEILQTGTQAAATLPSAEQIAQAVEHAAQGANVVRLDAVRQATTDARRESAEIVALCNLAGFPGLAAEFIEKATAVHVVRADLQRRRAAVTEAQQIEVIDTSPRTSGDGVVSELSKVLTARWASQMGRT